MNNEMMTDFFSGKQELPHGLYRIIWTGGSYSLAAVGSDSAGRRWFAPCNWVSGMPCFDWSVVERAIKLYADDDLLDELEEISPDAVQVTVRAFNRAGNVLEYNREFSYAEFLTWASDRGRQMILSSDELVIRPCSGENPGGKDGRD